MEFVASYENTITFKAAEDKELKGCVITFSSHLLLCPGWSAGEADEGGAEGGGGIPASLTLSYLRPELKPCQVLDLLSPPATGPGRPLPDLRVEGRKMVLFLAPPILAVMRLTSAELSPSLLDPVTSWGEEADLDSAAASLLRLDWKAAVSVSSFAISRSGLDPPLLARLLLSLFSVSG